MREKSDKDPQITVADEGTELSAPSQEGRGLSVASTLGVAGWMEKREATAIELDLSVVIPAYNEQFRLPATLVDIIDYLEGRALKYELIVVDDGSRDGTSSIVTKMSKLCQQVQLVVLPKNSGKGAAVKAGMLSARGRQVLFADADGATPIAEYEKLAEAIKAGADVVIASRALPSESTQIRTSVHRKVIGRIFNWIVNALLVPDVADTQCGFKLFTNSAKELLFRQQTLSGFAFDVEILYLGQRSKLKIAEVPVNWRNIPGSKVNLMVDSTRMFLDLFVVLFRHSNAARSGQGKTADDFR